MSQKNRLVTLDDTPVVTLDEFKIHVKWDLDDTTEDTTMEMFIKSATQLAEKLTRRTLFLGQWATYLDEFPCKIRLEVNPVDLDSIVVKYYDSNNDLQTLAAAEYFIRDNGPDDLTEIEFDGTIPATYDKYEAVVIEYTAGYGEDAIPEMLKVAIMKRAGKDLQHRINGDAAADENDFYRDVFQFKQIWEE
jgi:uncharacterized phiE125 gp8 family phage protein